MNGSDPECHGTPELQSRDAREEMLLTLRPVRPLSGWMPLVMCPELVTSKRGDHAKGVLPPGSPSSWTFQGPRGLSALSMRLI